MRGVLLPHPDFPNTAIDAIEVGMKRTSAGQIYVRYRAVAPLGGDARWPVETTPERTDELWKHTCFEAFLRAEGDAAYCEFNFSPSSQWAAYVFDSYRAGMRNAEVEPPTIRCTAGFGTSAHTAEVGLSLPTGLVGRPLRVGLAAVIEDAAGGKSYWALAHPPGKPDFHHADGFAARLGADD